MSRPGIEFLDLPLEIRHIIYDYSLNGVQTAEYLVVCSTPTIERDHKKKVKSQRKRKRFIGVITDTRRNTLLTVNRQVRKETFNLIFAKSTFHMACHHPYTVLPDAIRPNINFAESKFIDDSCRKDIYTFSALRQLKCHVHLADGCLGQYGFDPTRVGDTEVEMKNVVLFGLNPKNPWTLADIGYGIIMRICLDTRRWFKVLVIASCCWYIGTGGDAEFSRRLVTVDVDNDTPDKQYKMRKIVERSE